MNIKRYFILNTKEIRYITSTKNKKFIRGKTIYLNMINQYKDKNYNKFSISISTKFHKKAVYRNIVRRIFFDIVYKNDLVRKNINGKYFKIQVSLKKGLEYEVKAKDFNQKIRKDMENDLKKLFSI